MEKVDLSGEVLDGRYRVIEPVAEGAMGVVYRAERVKLGRIVAIKVLHDVLPSELSSRKRFEIEAIAMAKLEHPHCAAVLDVGIHGDRPFVVMDFVSGKNLKQVISDGPIAIPRAVEIVRQILSGLAHAHEHGIIHRDIKPANIVLSQKAGLGDHVKILDFGLARVSKDSSLTTGIVVGTPSYMAPEQIRGVLIDARVDVYACGVVLFELLTGKKPFFSKNDDPIEVCTMHLKAPIPRMSDIAAGKDFGALEDVVVKALAKTPDERWASAVEFAAALDEVVPRRGLSTPAIGVPVLATPSAGVPVAGTALGIAVVRPGSTSGPANASGPTASKASSFAAVSGDPSGEQQRASTAPTDAFDRGRAATAPSRTTATQEAPEPESSLSIPQDAPAPRTAPPPPPRGASDRPSPYAPTEPSGRVVDDSIGRPGGPPMITRKQLAIGGGTVLAVIILIAIVASRTEPDPSKTPREPGFIEMPVDVTPQSDPAGDVVSRANNMLAKGQREAAIDLLLASRKTYPKDARLAFIAGKAFFSKLWWNDGLKHLRDALRLDPAYRKDPELIKTVLRGFITTPRYDRDLAAFLREDVGAAARPYLEETAETHPNPNIRARATNELKRYH